MSRPRLQFLHSSHSAAPSPEAASRKPGEGGKAKWEEWRNWNPTQHGAANKSDFVSSIKALNLEPMRANPQQQKARPAAKAAAEAPSVPAGQNQQAQPQPSPAQPQPQPPQPQPQPQPQQQPAPTMPVQQQPPQQQQQQQVQQHMHMQMNMQQMQGMMQGVPMGPAMGGMHMMGGMVPMQPHQMPQMMQPQQQPVPSVGPATTAAKKTTKKLKNQAINKAQRPVDDDDDDRKDDDDHDKAEITASPMPGNVMPQARRVNLKPADNIFDRTLMLRIWRSHRHEMHAAVQGLRCDMRGDVKGGSSAPPQSSPVDRRGGVGRDGRRNNEPTDRASIFGTDMKTGGKSKGGKSQPEAMLKTSETGYRVIKNDLTRQEKLDRETRALLNKISPDNLDTVCAKLADIELFDAKELESVIKIIFNKALLEPHYCETYANMVYLLKNKYPDFPPENEGEKPQSFTRVLLNTCQNEFERLPSTIEPTEEERKLPQADIDQMMSSRKKKMLANMKFIGHMYLRGLLAVKVIGQVVHDLIGVKERAPEEHMIECVVELLGAIGYELESNSSGKDLMQKFVSRLQELKKQEAPDKTAHFSKRVQFVIQDLIDLRNDGWKKKLFKEQAMKKDELRKQQEMELIAKQRKGGGDVMFTTTVAGARPDFLPGSRAGQRRETETAKVQWSDDYVKRIVQYYKEDRKPEIAKAEDLAEAWKKAKPTPEELQRGVAYLLNTGFSAGAHADTTCAAAIVALISNRAISWAHLQESLTPILETFDELVIDEPRADLFFHALMGMLLAKYGKELNVNIFRCLASNNTWELFVGALKYVTRGLRDILESNKELVELLGKPRNITDSDALRAALRKEGVNC